MSEAIIWLAVVMLILLFSGMPISLALLTAGIVGLYFALPRAVPGAIASQPWTQVNSFVLTAVPLFVLMGEFLLRSGISESAYQALNRWLGRIPGGLAHTNIAACALFAAVSGSSTATAATVGTVAFPAMRERGYERTLTFGTIAAGGTLGILIPPSIPLIIYGAVMGESVGRLFIAGMIPGLLLSLAFMAYIGVLALRNPAIAPKTPETFSFRRAAFGSVGILPAVFLIVLVLGTIYAGIATPTEAAAFGAAGAFLLALIKRKVNWTMLKESLIGATQTTSMILLIVAGASVLNYVILRLGLPEFLVRQVTTNNLDPAIVLLLIFVMYIILGMFLDPISMMVMTLPVLRPLMAPLGIDLIWFGVILVVLIEAGLLTPPVGLNLFVVRGIEPSATTAEVVRGSMPFVAIMVAILALLVLVPGLITWLPNRLM